MDIHDISMRLVCLVQKIQFKNVLYFFKIHYLSWFYNTLQQLLSYH